MVPVWGRKPLARGAVLGVAVVLLLVAAAIVRGNRDQGPDSGLTLSPPVRKIVVPEVMPPSRRKEPAVPGKPTRLSEAIDLMDKSKKAVRAEVSGEGDHLVFEIEIAVSGSERRRLRLNAAGAIMEVSGESKAKTKEPTIRGFSPSVERPVEPISLREAVGLVESADKGKVLKGERKGEGAATQFEVEVQRNNGARSIVLVNATGKAIVEAAAPKKRNNRGTRR